MKSLKINVMAFFEFLKPMVDTYDERKYRKDCFPNGLKVSTAFTIDMGWETAIIDREGTKPVERYPTKEEAIEGHKKWVEFAEKGIGKTIIKLGYSWKEINVPEQESVLKP